MKVEKTSLEGVVILTPARFGDSRGFFSESWNQARMAEQGLNIDFVQDNHSVSATCGTIRGLHFQTAPHAQIKLVRCGRGALLDVAVDIRRGSPSYGKWVAETLSAENGRQLLIPAGFAHGFVTLDDNTEIVYKCSDYYAPDCDRALMFDDPDIAVNWGIDRSSALVSDKDAAAPSLSDLDNPFFYKGL
ncbi:MAG: dTDP-4-dehydrorhamnose 3,5-epimerase [Paracoccaceae bacterium]